MRLENSENIADISRKSNFTCFFFPDRCDFSKILPNSFHLKPDEKKNKILIDQIRDLTRIVNSKQESELIIVVEHAELMVDQAQNAFLKMLEEPNDRVHYVFLCANGGTLLPTIRSRAYNYYLKSQQKITDQPHHDEKTLALAKSYIAATPKELYAVAEKISKLDKKQPRAAALQLIAVSIELLYKSYFKTGNPQFLAKLEKLLAAEEAIRQNGNLKLQLIANML